MFKVISNSFAALESMWTSFGALGKGKLGAKLGEQIAVLVADMNCCSYCLSAHTVLGQKAGASAEEMAEILAHVALNIFTNYTNEAFNVENDFPKTNLRQAA